MHRRLSIHKKNAQVKSSRRKKKVFLFLSRVKKYVFGRLIKVEWLSPLIQRFVSGFFKELIDSAIFELVYINFLSLRFRF